MVFHFAQAKQKWKFYRDQGRLTFLAPRHQTPPEGSLRFLNSLFAARACAPKWEPACRLGQSGTEYVAMVTKLKLWCTFSRILLQRIIHFWYKLAEICFFHHIRSKFCRVYDVINWLISIFYKPEYLWNKKRYLKIVNRIFLLMQATCLCFKMASIEKMHFSS